MDNLNQTEVIKNALKLEKQVSLTKSQLHSLTNQKPDFQRPPVPVHKTVKRTYPEIVSQVRFKKRIAFAGCAVDFFLLICASMALSTDLLGVTMYLFPLAIIWFVIYYTLIKRKKEQDVFNITNSTEYKDKCMAADKEFDRIQAEFDREFQETKTEYETKLLPDYEKRLDEWTINHNKKIDETKKELANTEENLNELYNTTKIVPLQYREIEALEYIYNTISTSNYDITYAIDSYDKHRQRKLDEEKIQLEQERLYEQRQANQIAEEQAYLLQEQNAIAEQARKDANRAAMVSAVQRHNTNKALKELNKKNG